MWNSSRGRIVYVSTSGKVNEMAEPANALSAATRTAPGRRTTSVWENEGGRADAHIRGHM